jgi:serine protease Do
MRLLLVTIAVSVGMLLLLARFRFPDDATDQTAAPAPPPLERLAASATYDELAGIMGDLERRVRPTIIPLAVQGSSGVAFIPAVRVTADRAVAILPADRRLAEFHGVPVPAVIARDASRSLIVVQTNTDGPEVALPSAPAKPGPRYVAVAEATARAAAIRPTFIGRTDPLPDPRWPEPVLAVAAVQQTLMPGAAVFSLDSSFVGLASESGGTVTIIPGTMLRTIAAAVPTSMHAESALPIEVEPLTAALGRAASADNGVMVSFVASSIRTASDIAPGDVVQSVDGIGITTVEGFDQVAQSRTPGAQATLNVVRRGKPHTVTLEVSARGAREAGSGTNQHGMRLRPIDGVGSEVIFVQPGSPAGRAGLRRGDVIVSLDAHAAPEPSRVDRTFAAARAGDVLLLAVQRDSAHRMLALEKQ